MKISELISQLETLAPPPLQESYDNSGLIVGNAEDEVKSAVICLDSTEQVVEEAIELGANLIIAHHPILFSGIKQLNGKNYIERTIIKAIKHDIAIYAIHTNLDNMFVGVNHKIASKLSLEKLKILQPKKEVLRKLVFFCPTNKSNQIREALFSIGAGVVGNYDSCSFSVSGNGTFRANDKANPYVGKSGELHTEKEKRVEIIFPNFLEKPLIKKLIEMHPYDEVAYDLFRLENNWNEVGAGLIGELSEEINLDEFLAIVKTKFNANGIRYTKATKNKVKRIAVCGGSGSFLLNKAISQKADVLLTADFKYHQFFDAEDKISIVDIGHYESEQFTMELLQEYLKEKIPNFASYLTTIYTNPINYF